MWPGGFGRSCFTKLVCLTILGFPSVPLLVFVSVSSEVYLYLCGCSDLFTHEDERIKHVRMNKRTETITSILIETLAKNTQNFRDKIHSENKKTRNTTTYKFGWRRARGVLGCASWVGWLVLGAEMFNMPDSLCFFFIFSFFLFFFPFCLKMFDQF